MYIVSVFYQEHNFDFFLSFREFFIFLKRRQGKTGSGWFYFQKKLTLESNLTQLEIADWFFGDAPLSV